MISKDICVLMLWTKVASALEVLKMIKKEKTNVEVFQERCTCMSSSDKHFSFIFLFSPLQVCLCQCCFYCFILVPINHTEGIQMLYVFVDIKIDLAHFLETVRFNFTAGTRIAMVSTIQFVTALQVRKLPDLYRKFSEI